jgi:hypothetical protein
MKRHRSTAAALAALGFLCAGREASAQEKASTCIEVEARADEVDSLRRLVRSEVDRHPSHRATEEHCAVHLRVELIEIESERFLTGRVGGEVPERVRVEGPGGKPLEAAVDELLRIVLGNDPVSLKAPGGQSWFSERVFSLKERGRNTFDIAFLESASPVVGSMTYASGLSLGFSREVESWQIGIEALWMQNFAGHTGRADLDTSIRLQAALTLFTSEDSDASAFFGVALGLAHQRFSGPRAKDLGGGDGAYQTTGPGIGLRGGVEFFRTTTTRAFVMAEAFLPVFWANDQEAEIISGWVPAFSVGSGVRF